MRSPINKLFWFSDAKKLNKRRDKVFIIHHTLANGSLEDIHNLFALYPKNEVRRIFLHGQAGLYDERTLALLKKLFDIKRLNERKFIKHVY